MGTLHNKFEELFLLADVRINGDRAWDMHVHDDRLYSRILTKGTLGMGEAYMDGWWDSDSVDQLITRLINAKLREKIAPHSLIWPTIRAKILNLQNISRAFQVGEAHYNLGNDLFERMLDKRMTYSCGYWKNAYNIDAAQEAKLDLICRKIGLQKGQKVLDIGCGWGSFSGFAAEHYGVEVFGVTVSSEQGKWIEERYAHLPVKVVVKDYRELEGQYDHIVSIGMFEHVGRKNYREFMQVVKRCLKPDGLFLLHTIGRPVTRNAAEPWVTKYIFPNAQLPSIADISSSIEKLFVMEDLHNFGADYDITLMAWHESYEQSWPEFKDKYDDRFYRMWRYYLLSNAASFRARSTQLWQMVFSQDGVPGGYDRVS
jgi:cyclopropane-fatty-acyl-phospholipid synthase